MNQQAVNERIKAAPNPVINSYRKIVDQRHHQIIDNNHAGWKILALMIYKNRQKFFDQQGHWKSWKDSKLQARARSYAEKAVSIGLMLTKYWHGKSLNMMESAMLKPYLKLGKQIFLN